MGLLVLGGTGLAFYPSREAFVPVGALHVLSSRSFQVLAAIASRVVVAPDSDPVVIAHAADVSLSYLSAESQKDINRLLGLFENALGGLILDGHIRPFTRLPADEKDRVLARWRDSTVALRRTGYQALRKLCLSAHYAMPSSWASIGYPAPTPVGEPYDDSKMGTPAWNTAHGLDGPP